MQDKQLFVLKSILKIHLLFWQELWTLELHKTFDLTYLQLFLTQPLLKMHLANPCPSSIDFKRAALLMLISVFDSTSASDKS